MKAAEQHPPMPGPRAAVLPSQPACAGCAWSAEPDEERDDHMREAIRQRATRLPAARPSPDDAGYGDLVRVALSPAPHRPDTTGMPQHVRAKMESSFRADFSDVRVHTASPAATRLGALAYTQRNDIHVAPGHWAPETTSGQQLLGHELAHVLQQRAGRVAPTAQAAGVPLNDDPGLESEADALGAQAARAEAGAQLLPLEPVQGHAEAGAAESHPVQRVSAKSIQGELGEMIATQFLDEQGLIVFQNWSKNVNATGFDFIAYEPKTARVWFVDNKAYSGTISEVTSLSPANLSRNVEEAKKFLQQGATAESRAALAAIESNAVEKVVINAYSKGNAGFSEKIFQAGIKAFDVRLGKLFSSRAAWLSELNAAGLMSGVRRFSRADRILGRQRGFATVGGLIFTLLAVGSVIYAISEADDKLEAVEELAADLIIGGLAYRLGGGVAVIAVSLLGLCSDNAEMQRECERKDVVMRFLRKRMPSAIKRWGWGLFEEPDPVIYKEAYDLLFNTAPIVLPPRQPTAPVAAPAPPYSPAPPPPPE